jgi:hypothetical protein
MGCAKANRREPKSCLGQVFNFKLGCFVMCTITVRFCASMHVGFRANVIMTKSHCTDLNIGLEWSVFNIFKKLLLYFIKYNVHTSIVRTWIPQWFLAKFLFLFFKNNFTRINHCMFIHHKSHLKPFLNYLPCKVHREYFSIIFNVKKCTLYSEKYGNISLCFFNV